MELLVAAPKGNQYAVGLGRPPKWNPEELAEKIEIWSQREDARWTGDFAIEIDMPDPSYFRDLSDKSQVFADAYKKAKLRIASRLRKTINTKDSGYNYGLFMREIGQYDAFLREDERGEKKFEATLAKEIAESGVTPELVDRFEAVMAQIKRGQEERKSSLSNNKSDK